MTSRPRIALFALRDLHVPVLEPVWRALVAAGADVGLVAPPYVPSGEGRVQEGLAPATEARLSAAGVARWRRRAGERFDAVITADACYDRVDGWGPVVCVGHGTISKGLYFTRRPIARRENFARVLCVPGPAYATAFGDAVFTRIVPTGFPPLDALATVAPDHRARHLEAHGLDPDLRTVLFAPTYNPELTALDGLAPLWPALDARDQVVFKLHGATDAVWVARYRALAATLPRAHFVEDGALVPWLLAADVVVSDVSSAVVEAIAAGRPVVAFNNPRLSSYPHVDRRAVEFAVRDACYAVATVDECRVALDALRVADPLAPRRVAHAARLFAPLDGGHAARVAAVAIEVAMGRVPHTFPDGFTLNAWQPADVSADDQARIDANLARAWSPVRLSVGDVPPQPFVCMTGETEWPEGWDLVWAMASRFNAPAGRVLSGVFGPTLPDLPEYGPQRLGACFADAPALPPTARQVLYKHHAADQIAVADTLRLDGAFVAGVTAELAAAWVAADADRPAVLRRVRQRGVTGVLPGFHAVPPGPSVPTPDFLFYAQNAEQLSRFAPVMAEVRRRRPDARLAYATPAADAAPALDGAAGAEWIGDGVSARPGVTIVAGAIGDRFHGHARIVNLGHSLGETAPDLDGSPVPGAENLAHELCVPGPWHAARLRPHLYVPIHVTGMPALDALFAPFDDAACRQSLGVGARARVIWWCPTLDAHGVPSMAGEMRRLTALGTVLVTPRGDPAHVPDLVAAVSDPNVRVLPPGVDTAALMRVASVLVTDVAPVVFPFAALDRPIVLIDDPRLGVRPSMRDIGPVVADIASLLATVAAELETPGRFAEARRRATDAMFVAVDGRNAERIASVLCGPPPAMPWRDGFDVVMPESFTAEDLAHARPGLLTASRVLVPPALEAAAADLPSVVYRDAQYRRHALERGAAPNVVVYRRRARLVGDWQAPLFGPLYLDRDPPRMTAPLTTDARAASYVGHFLKRDRITLPDRVTPDFLADVIRLTNPAERAPAPDLQTALLATRKATLLQNATGKAPVTVLDALVVS